MTRDAPIAGPDFTVLTGFLGSGKTTLLRDFLETGEAPGTAIIVNEVGAIGLDGALLREVGGAVSDGLPLTMLSNGCICCQTGSDLAWTVEALLAAERPAGAPPLRRIVLETSGLSKPGPVLRQLAPLAGHRMRVSVMATFDAGGRADEAGFEEAAAQWAGAQRIVVTKVDSLEPGGLAGARDRAAALNPLAAIVASGDRAETVRRAFAPPEVAGGPVLPPRLSVWADDAAPHPRIATFLLRQASPVPDEALADWLDNLAGALGERLLRLKGLVAVADEPAPLLVQSVGTVFSAPRPFRGAVPAGGPFLVVIGRDLDGAEIEAVTPRLGFAVSGWSGATALGRPLAGGPGRLRAEAV